MGRTVPGRRRLRHPIVAAKFKIICIQTIGLDRRPGLAHSREWQDGQQSDKLGRGTDLATREASTGMRTALALGFGLTFEELYRRDGLIRLDQAFTTRLRDDDPALFNRLMAARAAPDDLADKDESALLI